MAAAAAAVERSRRRSRSPSRPTGGSPRASRCARPIEQVDADTGSAARPTSWSTARTRPISRRRWTHDGPWLRRVGRVCGPTPRRRSHAELDEADGSRRGRSRRSFGARLAALRERLPAPRCSAGAAAPTPDTWRRSGVGLDRALGSCSTCPLSTSSPTGRSQRRRGGGRAVRCPRRPRRRRAPLRAGVGDQAAGRPRGAGRGRGGRRRTRHSGGSARIDGAAPARPHLGAVRCAHDRRDRRARERGGSTPTTGFGVLAEAVERGSRISTFDRLPARGRLRTARHGGRRRSTGGAEAAGYGGESTVADLARSPATCCARRWCRPRCTPRPSRCSFPVWTACCPASAAQRPNDWGLGFEIRDGKSPHWTGSANSAATFGHFGQSGTFIWVDPAADLALVVLTDRDFGDWAHALWPALSDGVLREFGSTLAQHAPHRAQ